MYPFLKLDEYRTVRLITNPYQYYAHSQFVLDKQYGRYGQKVLCTGIYNKPDCFLCLSGNKPERRWVIGCISRLNNQFYLIDVGWNVFEQIRKLWNNSRWGAPETYDVNIMQTIDKGNVIPIAKSPLTARETTINRNLDRNHLLHICWPPTPQAMDDYIKRIKQGEYVDISRCKYFNLKSQRLS